MLNALPLALALALAANPYLDEGRGLYRALHYPQALSRLEVASRVPTSSPDERRETFDLLARCHAALGQQQQAEAAYTALLAQDPDARLADDASPKIQAVCDQAKQRLYPPDFVRLKRLPAPAERLEVRLIDPWRAVQALVVFEGARGGAFASRPLERDTDQGRANLDPGTDRLYVEARAADGSVLARLGSDADPLPASEASVAAPPTAVAAPGIPPEPPRKPRWPAWVIASASAVAAGVGAGLAVASASDARAARDRAPGGSGFFASDAAALDQRSRQEAVAANVLVGAAMTGGAVSGVLLVVF